MSSFLFLFLVSVESCYRSPRARLRVLRLRVAAGHGVESYRIESCGTDVEDVCSRRWAGRSGWQALNNERHEIFSVALYFLSFLQRCGSWPLNHEQGYPWSTQSFPSDRTAGVSSRISTVTNNPKSWTYTVVSPFVCISSLVVITVVGSVDTRIVSSSAAFRYFLLSMCTEFLESATNCLSSGFVEDWVRNDQISEGEWNVAGSFSPSLCTFFSISYASLRGAFLLFQSFFLRFVIKFRSIRATLMRIRMLNGPVHSWIFTWRDVPFEKRTLHLSPKDFVPFREIELDVGGSTSWNTQLACSEFFNMATELLPPVFFCLLGWLSTSLCVKSLFSNECVSRLFCTCDIREDAEKHMTGSCT